MVVDDVKQHHQAAAVRGVDERLEIFWPAVGRIRRKPQHAVITPVAAAEEIRDRHQFYCGKAGAYDFVETIDRGSKRPARRECADMQFEDDRLMPRPAAPSRRLPFKAVINHFAWAENVLRLKGRCRIGHFKIAVDAKLVLRAGPRLCHRCAEPAALGASHRGYARCDHVNRFRRRRPKAKFHSCFARNPRPESRGAAHARPSNTVMEWLGAICLAPT